MERARVLLICCVVSTLMAAQMAHERRATNHSRTEGPRVQASDRELEAAIRARFARSKIAVNHFEVSVQGGVATLTGKTNVIQHKGTATRLARAAGAVQVVNKIEPSQAARDRASVNLAKGRRRAQVKRSEARSQR